MSKIFKVWLDRLAGATISNTHAQTFGHYLMGRGKKNNLTGLDLDNLVGLVLARRDHGDPLLADEPSRERGERWLKTTAYRHLTDDQRQVVDSGIVRFELMDWTSEGRPLWRAVGRNGYAFIYFVEYNRSDALSGKRYDSPVHARLPERVAHA